MAVNVTRDFIRAFNPVVKALFQDAYLPQANIAKMLATFVDSTLPSEDYSWIGQLPIMKEWFDERQIQALKEYGFTIKNRKFEATIAIQREVLEDEQRGLVRARIMQLADAANAHYDQLLFSLLNGNGNAYDGAAFYSVARGNLTAVGTALSAASLTVALAAMRKQKMDNGEPLDVNPTHLLVPPDLEVTALTIANSVFTPESGGTRGQMATNVFKGRFEVVVCPRLPTATEWHLFDCSHYVKPFIIQQRLPITMDMLDTESDSDVTFLRDEYLYGVRSRDNAGYGLPQYAYKNPGA